VNGKAPDTLYLAC